MPPIKYCFNCLRTPTGYILFLLYLFILSQCSEEYSNPDSYDTPEEYWLNPQGTSDSLPAKMQKLAEDLNPKTCAGCHPKQYNEWKTSRHSMAMTPGLLSRAVNYDINDSNSMRKASRYMRACFTCHGPLQEQTPTGYYSNDVDEEYFTVTHEKYDRGLNSHGVTCASCHVRKYVRYGPNHFDTSLAGKPNIHDGYQKKDFFSESSFCKHCHQFPTPVIQNYKNDPKKAGRVLEAFDPHKEEITAITDGAYFENIYIEWKKSRFYKDGISCQKCHMPEGYHGFRGIHSKDMVRKGLDIKLFSEFTSDQINAILEIKSVWIGHDFPAYATPRVDVSVWVEDSNAEEIDGLRLDKRMDWQITNVNKKIVANADSRLSPDETFRVNLYLSKDFIQPDFTFHASIKVTPDYFYFTKYEEAIKVDTYKPAVKKLFQEAYDHSITTIYNLYSGKLALDKEQMGIEIK